VALNFGTPGLITDGKRDGLYSDAAGSYQMVNGVNQYVPSSTASAVEQDGYQDGQLQTLSWDSRGVLNGSFTNGQTVALAQLGLASVTNPGGLARAGGNDFVQTANSGSLYSGTAGENGLGTVHGGTLEGSNVDLTTELSDMIVAQRGFEVNAQVVQAANDFEKVLVNIGR
jgi:flagellar hook protein FlgE